VLLITKLKNGVAAGTCHAQHTVSNTVALPWLRLLGRMVKAIKLPLIQMHLDMDMHMS